MAGLLPLRHSGPDSSPGGSQGGERKRQLAFRGHYDYSLDAKNRLNVPPKFRASFSDGLVLAKGLEPCLWLWQPGAFDSFTEQVIGGLNPVSEERRKLTRYLAGNSFDAELDAAGRVTLTPALIEHAGLER